MKDTLFVLVTFALLAALLWGWRESWFKRVWRQRYSQPFRLAYAAGAILLTFAAAGMIVNFVEEAVMAYSNKVPMSFGVIFALEWPSWLSFYLGVSAFPAGCIAALIAKRMQRRGRSVL